MGKDVRNFAIGASLVAFSFAIGPLAFTGAMAVKGILFAAGTGFALGALAHTLPEHQAANLSTSIGPMSAIPVVVGEARVSTSIADCSR